MWKYVSRRIRDTFERSHFEKRSTTGFTTSPNGSHGSGPCSGEDLNKRQYPSEWFKPRSCWNTFYNDNGANNKRWNFDHLNRTWKGAITWSSALVLGWYTSQLIHMRFKYSRDHAKNCPSINTIFSSLYPYLNCIKKTDGSLHPVPYFERIDKDFSPRINLVSNDQTGESNEGISSESSSTTNTDSLNNDLGEVLNSIENKLGLAAIGNGHHQDGLNLLRSAAHRNHAPALYNLGICYEMGLGVSADEKMAMEFYRSAAARQHPAALYNLGIYYGQGRGGLAQDITMATRLLRLAAVQGHQAAVNALKELNVENAGSNCKSNEDSWTYSYIPAPFTPPNENIAPSQSSLFVDNTHAHFLDFRHTKSGEATVY